MNCTESIDELDVQTITTYDAYGNLTSKTDPLGRQTQYFLRHVGTADFNDRSGGRHHHQYLRCPRPTEQRRGPAGTHHPFRLRWHGQ